jgi:cobalt-zinc-cadmium efflux system protein
VFEHDHHRHDRRAAHTLGRAVTLTFGFAAIEAATGWWANSLALLSDAGHMVTDGLGLVGALVAAEFARRPATTQYTYGYGRAEVLAAAMNALVMLALVAGIAIAAIGRFHAPQPIEGGAVAVVALLGLGVNLLVYRVLHHGAQTINVRGAALHVIGDALGSVAALAAGLVVWFTGWTPIDPLLSLLVCGLLIGSSVRLLRDALDVVLERVPRGLDVAAVGRSMAAQPGVKAVHDLHIWTASSDTIALSAHVVVDKLADWDHVLPALKRHLDEVYRIEHVTLQPEPLAQPLRHMPRPG